MIVRFDPIYVQCGKLKQKFRPWRTTADFAFIEASPDDPLRLDDFGEDSDGGLIVGLTVERLKREVKFAVPGSAVAMRNGVALADGDLVVPGDVIEFVRHRASEKSRESLHQEAADEPASDSDIHDDTKLVLSNFSVKYKGQECFLGNHKPFAILERLNRTPKDFVSLETLRQDIWGVIDLVDDETIQKHVSNLRKKLEKAGVDGIVIDGEQRGHYRLVLK